MSDNAALLPGLLLQRLAITVRLVYDVVEGLQLCHVYLFWKFQLLRLNYYLLLLHGDVVLRKYLIDLLLGFTMDERRWLFDSDDTVRWEDRFEAFRVATVHDVAILTHLDRVVHLGQLGHIWGELHCQIDRLGKLVGSSSLSINCYTFRLLLRQRVVGVVPTGCDFVLFKFLDKHLLVLGPTDLLVEGEVARVCLVSSRYHREQVTRFKSVLVQWHVYYAFARGLQLELLRLCNSIHLIQVLKAEVDDRLVGACLEQVLDPLTIGLLQLGLVGDDILYALRDATLDVL